jgi:pyruvate dehydrogenase E1 component
MTDKTLLPSYHDIDPTETQEWLAALDSVMEYEGVERAQFLVEQLVMKARQLGIAVSAGVNTPYLNTISVTQEPSLPADMPMLNRLTAMLRWNAIIMVLRAGKKYPELGGHIATYASAALLYEIGFNYFFHARDNQHGGDLLYIQGHTTPGIYARAYLEGRLTIEQLDYFRREVHGKGISSYPHSWLMPHFWQFATVSMGLGPLQGIYQARFLKYLDNRGLADTKQRKVWVFCGDGEMDEPESLGAITLGGREHLDNLIFVINCNLQRLDGPVRGNSKIVQEFEGVFRGAGWNVIKVLWGRQWDALLAKDKSGLLIQRMNEILDGELQNLDVRDGAYMREFFFGKYPELKELVADLSDQQLKQLQYGGHDTQKMYAAYAAAVKHKGQPTLILVRTVKGYGMGAEGEALNNTHQIKKMGVEGLKGLRDRFKVPVSDKHVENLDFCHPNDDREAVQYMQLRRQALGGYLPARFPDSPKLPIPKLDIFAPLLESSGDREISTTMGFVRILSALLKDKELSRFLVPIVADESRTFGMEGLFRQIGIYSSVGQLYEPVDKAQVMYYREAKDGQLLQEGISEAGAFCSWLAAATSYSTNNIPLIPFYIFYSMFGFQRIGDLAWAAGDMRARGFLLGATSGRTTLAGEGLQHDDGHSHVLSSLIPNCVSYDPTFAYELAVIVHDGLRRMYHEQEDVYYYLTVLNENYHHPAMPKGVEQGIIKGMYLFQSFAPKVKQRVQLLGCGAILREVIKAAEILEKDYGIGADVWSVTSFTELRREALEIARYNALHPDAKPKTSYVAQCLAKQVGPIIAATDYVRLFADQLRGLVSDHYYTLGTDGFGRSDTRENLREFFEVDAKHIAFNVLHALAAEGAFDATKLKAAMQRYGIDADKPPTWKV